MIKYGDNSYEAQEAIEWLVEVGLLTERPPYFDVACIQVTKNLQKALNVQPTGEFSESLYGLYSYHANKFSIMTLAIDNSSDMSTRAVVKPDDDTYAKIAYTHYNTTITGYAVKEKVWIYSTFNQNTGRCHDPLKQIEQSHKCAIVGKYQNGVWKVKLAGGGYGYILGENLSLWSSLETPQAKPNNGNNTNTNSGNDTSTTYDNSNITTNNNNTTNTDTPNVNVVTVKPLEAPEGTPFVPSTLDVSMEFPCYIVNLITGTTIEFPHLPEEISFSKGTVFEEIATKGRFEPWLAYSGSSSPSVSVSMLVDANTCPNNNLEQFLYKVEALAYPLYNNKVISPKCYFYSMGFELEGILESIDITRKLPIINGYYSSAEISFNFKGASQVTQDASKIESHDISASTNAQS